MSKIKIYPAWLPCPECVGMIEVQRPGDDRGIILAECECGDIYISMKSIADPDSIWALDGYISEEEKIELGKEWNKKVLSKLCGGCKNRDDVDPDYN